VNVADKIAFYLFLEGQDKMVVAQNKGWSTLAILQE
jgi:hypothetical protein